MCDHGVTMFREIRCLLLLRLIIHFGFRLWWITSQIWYRNRVYMWKKMIHSLAWLTLDKKISLQALIGVICYMLGLNTLNSCLSFVPLIMLEYQWAPITLNSILLQVKLKFFKFCKRSDEKFRDLKLCLTVTTSSLKQKDLVLHTKLAGFSHCKIKLVCEVNMTLSLKLLSGSITKFLYLAARGEN